MKTPDDSVALSRIVYERLREDIISGELAPGMPLRLGFLRERYGLSFSPLREALNQLQVERLVTSTSNRGFRAATLSIPEMWDAIETRILVEGQAMRQSLRHGDDHWEGQVVSSFHALDKFRRRLLEGPLNPDEAPELEVRHQAFHFSLLAGCKSALLIQMANTLYALTERYRRPLLSRVEPETLRTGDPDIEHRAMMEAALERDSNRAIKLLSKHLHSTGQFIEASHRAMSSNASSNSSETTPRIATQQRRPASQQEDAQP